MSANSKSQIEIYVIGEVRKKRLEIRMSQSELANHLNVSNGFIGQVESHKYGTKYSIDQLNKIASVFSCSPKDFFPELPII